MKISEQGFDYDGLDEQYPTTRATDPRIAAHLLEALGEGATLLNVGAGTGSYEPADRRVVAVEPSSVMRSKRPVQRTPALAALAEQLPFHAKAFDASMAILTVHHWPDMERGLREMRRVTSGPVVVMTFDPFAPTDFWMGDYAPELVEVDQRRYGSLDRVTEALGGELKVVEVPVPRDCRDGFQVGLFARPEAFLEERVRQAQSAWAHLAEGVEQRVVRDLSRDLQSGEWQRRYGELQRQAEIRCQLRIVRSAP